MRFIRHRLPPWRRITPPSVYVDAVQPPYPSWLTKPPYYSDVDTRWIGSQLAPPGNIFPPGLFQFAALHRPPVYKTETATHFVGLDKRIPWIVPAADVPDAAWFTRPQHLSKTDSDWIKETPYPLGATALGEFQFAAFQPPVFHSRFDSGRIETVPLPFLGTPTVPPAADIVEQAKIYRTETRVRHISSPIVPWLAGGWSLFTFPNEGNFNANSILQPGWKIYFLEHGTSNNSPVSANNNGTLLHSAPVMLDRFANLPTIYTNDLINYDISVRNQFGVERHLIEGY